MKISKSLKVLLAIFVVGLIIGILSLLWVFRKAPESVGSEKAVVETSAANLIGAYNEDENLADKNYLGKVILVTGKLESFTSDSSEGKVSVTLKEAVDQPGVICEFPANEIDTTLLIKGKQLKIKGVCNGFLMDVVLNKCILVE